MDNELFELCCIEDCRNRHLARGYCKKHYQRWYKGKDVLAKSQRDERPPIIEGDIVKLPLGIDAKDGYAIVDSNFISLSRYKWFIAGNGYPTTNTTKGVVALHRFIITSESGMVIDHINTDKLDNRKVNLRLVTKRQNAMNKPANSIRKDSSFKGVILHSSGRWHAKIGFKGKSVSLGYFDKEIEAAKAYDRAALVYHGEFAHVNDTELRELLANVREQLGWVVTSSDYLLEKLPRQIMGRSLEIYGYDEETGMYLVRYDVMELVPSNQGWYGARADSPLKALLKLTLKLHDAGVKL